MRTLRTALTAAALCLLCAGYAASQIAYFQGTFMEYAAKVDTPPIQRLALLLLIAAVILALIEDRNESDELVQLVESPRPSKKSSVGLPFTDYRLLEKSE